MAEIRLLSIFVACLAVCVPQYSLGAAIDLNLEDYADLVTIIEEFEEGPETGTMGPILSTIFPDITSMTPETPEIHVGKWVVTGEDGKVCMRMEFIGNLLIHVGDADTEMKIAYNSDASSSTCSKSKPVFRLVKKHDDGANETVSMGFEKEDNVWQMKYVEIEVNTFSTDPIEEKHKYKGRTTDVSDVQAVVGSYYTCDNPESVLINEDDYVMKLTFEKFKFQPFAQLTADNRYGDKFMCGDAFPKKTHVGLIVGITLALVVTFALLGGIVCYKRRSSTNQYKPF